jgi:tripartite-type tricarboxylate transporter receptor subunit TctC
MNTRRRFLLATASAPVLMAASRYASAQASDYYKDKLINVIVSGSPSGGHSRYARLIQPYLQKHTGAREVRISNMPGGGGLKAAGHVWRLKPDGYSVLFGNVSTLILAPIAGSAGVTFDPTKFLYLGRATSEPRVLSVGGKSAIKTFEDVRKLDRPFVFPSQGTDEDFYTMAVLADALGFKLKAVTGYEGNADTALAVIKGDGDGHITGWSESQAAIKSGDKRPILMIASRRPPEAPDVPLVSEVAAPDKLPLVRAIVSINELHRSYIAPPGTDPQAVAAFRAALTKAMNDPELIEETRKSNRPVSFMEGSQQQREIEEIARASTNLAPILKAAVKAIQ